MGTGVQMPPYVWKSKDYLSKSALFSYHVGPRDKWVVRLMATPFTLPAKLSYWPHSACFLLVFILPLTILKLST